MDKIGFYYFSPTGGTKQVGDILCGELAGQIIYVNLGDRGETPAFDTEYVVFAMPVFGGRIPALALEKIKGLDGNGRKAILLAVYGNRAYEDALVEMEDAVKALGMKVLGAGAFVARHSIVPEVAAGRPDEADALEIKAFAEKIGAKIKEGSSEEPKIPGNRPYKEKKPGGGASPISTEECITCGACVRACPLELISIQDSKVVTDASRCFLCLSCTAVCPKGARILPPPMKEGTSKFLAPYLEVRGANEYFY